MSIETTVTVPAGFPMRAGETLRIKNANGRGIYATYEVGGKLESNKKETIFAATVKREPRRA